MAIELYADQRGFTFYVSLPDQLDGTIQQLVTTHLVGASLAPVSPADDRICLTAWDRVIEIGASGRHEPLRMPSPSAAVALLLSAFVGLGQGEALAQQWVITAARPSRPVRKDETATWPHQAIEAAADKKEHDEPLFLAVGRLAARSHHPEALLARLRGPYASLATPGVHFRRRLASPTAALVRLRERTAAGARPTVINAAELAVVSGLPFGRLNVPGLSLVRSRRLIADQTIPREGLVIGTGNYPGAERPIALRAHDLLKHTHIHGKTGVGKSALLVNLAVRQMEAGFGVGLIDPTGATAADLLERIPPDRTDDVVVFEPTDTDYPVGFNLFDSTGNPEVLADQLMAIFHGIYKDSGIYTSNYLRAAIQTLASVPGMTLVEVVPFLTNPRFLARIMRQISDPMLTNLWERFDQDRAVDQLRQVQPAIHRAQPLLLRRSVRLTLGQADNRLDLALVLRERKILVASLPKGPLGEETSALFGSLVFARLWQASMSRPRNQHYPFFLHIDEAQNCLHMPLPISDVLAESRKYGLGRRSQRSGYRCRTAVQSAGPR